MTTNSDEGKDMDHFAMSENEIPKNLDKEALVRIEKLSQLSFRSIHPSIEPTKKSEESAYKKRGFDLKHIPHSSEKVAKDFDDSI